MNNVNALEKPNVGNFNFLIIFGVVLLSVISLTGIAFLVHRHKNRKTSNERLSQNLTKSGSGSIVPEFSPNFTHHSTKKVYSHNEMTTDNTRMLRSLEKQLSTKEGIVMAIGDNVTGIDGQYFLRKTKEPSENPEIFFESWNHEIKETYAIPKSFIKSQKTPGALTLRLNSCPIFHQSGVASSVSRVVGLGKYGFKRVEVLSTGPLEVKDIEAYAYNVIKAWEQKINNELNSSEGPERAINN